MKRRPIPRGPSSRDFPLAWRPNRKHRARYRQAEHIIALFGGPALLADAIGVDVSTVYRWTMPGESRPDGIIPRGAAALISECARNRGVLLSADDWALKPRAEA